MLVSEVIKQMGFSRGPTGIEVYRKLDPEYDPDHPEISNAFDDDDDGCTEENSFVAHCAMDARTTKKAIEEDRKEREEEKRQQREAALKKKGKSSQKGKTGTQKPNGTNSTNGASSTKPKPPPAKPKDWLDEK